MEPRKLEPFEKVILRARDDFNFWDGINIYLYTENPIDKQQMSVLSAIMVEDQSVHRTLPSTCTIHLDGKQTQVLMDDLWNSGVRPSTEIKKNETQATAHISDLNSTINKLDAYVTTLLGFGKGKK